MSMTGARPAQRLRPEAADRLLAVVLEVADSGSCILRSRCATLEERLARACGNTRATLVASPASGLLLTLTAVGVRPGHTVAVAAGAPGFTAAVARRLGALPGPPDGAAPVGVTVQGGGDSVAPDALTVVVADGWPGPDAHHPAAAATVLDLGPEAAVAGVGEAAAVLTDDTAVADRVRMLRNHGQDGRTRFLHHLVGFNARVDEIVASWLLTRLEAGSP